MVLSFCAALQWQWREYRSTTSAAPALRQRRFGGKIVRLPAVHSNADEKTNAAFMILT
jgi:hypothetical protein